MTRHARIAALLLLLTAALPFAARGQFAWTGNAGNNWSDPGNWLGAVVPPKNATVTLSFDAGAASFTPIADQTWTLGAMTFTTTGYSVSGLPLSLDGVATIANAVAATTSVSNDLALLAPLFVVNDGSLTLSGPITGAQDVFKFGTGPLVVSGLAYPTLNTTIIQQGTLTFGDGATGPADVGAIVNNGVLVFNVPSTEVHGPVTGTGSVTVQAGSIVRNNSGAGFMHQGATTVNGQFDGTSHGFSVNNNALLTLGPGALFQAFTGSVGSLAGNGLLAVTANTFFAGSDNTSTTFSGSLNGPGNFTKTGSGSLTFTDPVFAVGTATVEAPGAMRLGNMITGPSNTNALVTNGSLVFATPSNTNVNGPVTGTGTVTVEAGAIVANRSGAGFAHQGSTTVNGIFDGTSLGFSVNNNALLTLGPGALFTAFTGSVGSLAGTGQLVVTANTFFVGSDNTSTTFDGLLAGPGNFAKVGGGTLTFSGGGTWVNGTTSVDAPGTLALGNSVSGPSDVNALVVNGSLVFATPSGTDVNGPVTGTGTVTVQPNAIVINKSGAGFAHQGPTTVHGMFDGSSLGFSVNNNALLTIVGPASVFLAFTGSVGSLAGSGQLAVTANTFFVGSDNTSTTFSGTRSGAGALAKVGTGVLTLSGTSGPGSGAMLVNAGTLSITGGFFTTGVTVAAGATLMGNGSIAGPVTVNAGGTLAPGLSAGNLDTESLTLAGTLNAEIFGTTPGTQHDRVNVLGNVTLNNATLNLSGPYVPAPGNVFVLIANDSTDAVTGTFAGLPEGATLTFNGVTLRISYAGGTGNDVVLSHAAYTVTPSAPGGNGTIAPNTAQSVTHGSTTSFTVTPSVGYTASVGGTCPAGSLVGTTYTTGAIVANCTVVATFTLNTYTVTPSAPGGNGTITPNTAQPVNHGSTTTFTVTPNAGYTVSVGGTCPPGSLVGTTYTTGAIVGNCTVDATFALNTYPVTPSAGSNGSISPNTTQSIAHGGTATFTVTPNAGYTPSVGGTCPAGSLAGTTYTTGTITSACTVTAAFTLNNYTVTPSAGANGSIAPNAPQTVGHGATRTFTVTPTTGYTASVGGTCGGSLVGTTYTTNPITADCTVVASFVQNTYIVTPSAGSGSTITPNTPQVVAQGATIAFTVTTLAGVPVVGGTCGGTLVGAIFTTNPITANCTVVASFAIPLSPPIVTSFTGPTATGTGNATASFAGGGATCTFALAQFIPVSGHANSPPAGSAPAAIVFPHGLFDFRLTGCTPGSTITMTITYPQALAPATQYWKYGPEPGNATPHWYVMPATIGAATAVFSITDGMQGDDDLAANGTFVDQGGPGVPPGFAQNVQTPTMSEWMMLLMAVLMLLAAARRREFRRQTGS